MRSIIDAQWRWTARKCHFRNNTSLSNHYHHYNNYNTLSSQIQDIPGVHNPANPWEECPFCVRSVRPVALNPHHKKVSWSAIANALVGIVSAFPAYETNAQRMARGLPPNPPAQFARRATAVRGAGRTNPSPHPSPQPSVCHTGKIQVRTESDGHPLGFVRNWENGGISGINFSGDPLEVKVCKAHAGLYDIIATNAVFPRPFYVGAGSGPVARSLTTGERSSVGFGNVPKTPPNAPPTLIDGNYFESAIWSYNPSTKELSPQWINPDGTKPQTTIAYDIRANGLFFVGDISVWNEPGFFASAVHFYLV